MQEEMTFLLDLKEEPPNARDKRRTFLVEGTEGGKAQRLGRDRHVPGTERRLMRPECF